MFKKIFEARNLKLEKILEQLHSSKKVQKNPKKKNSKKSWESIK